MPKLDIPACANFSARMFLDGKDAEGAALYVNDRLMDVVKLDPEISGQPLEFWGGAPVHFALLSSQGVDDRPVVMIRVFTTSEDLCVHKLTIEEIERTVYPQENCIYVMRVTARNYTSPEPLSLWLCYAPDGALGYIASEVITGSRTLEDVEELAAGKFLEGL